MAKQYYITTDVYASHSQRIGNLLLDTFVMLLIVFLVTYFGIKTENKTILSFVSNLYFFRDFPYDFILSFCYYTLFEFLFSRSLAKYITGTLIVDYRGEKPDFMAFVLRSLSRFIPFESISFLWPFGRGWHDMISKTYVVDKVTFENHRKEFFEDQNIASQEPLLKRTTSDNPDFQKLVVKLDAYLAVIDGEDHAFYAQFNKSILLKNVLVCYQNENAIAIGAYKEYDSETAEIKRMFTLPEHRGKGIASKILAELELWAKEEKYKFALLETGHLQKDAIYLYQKLGYKIIENFGQYQGVENSICMKKNI
jgi:GNAT superfamily N-acetyltransferase/uncharacterized RDD family membrane protein YckC